jgi:hypothetical protein
VRKKDLQLLVHPLIPKVQAMALCLVPDDLQAQQITIDAFTQCLLKHTEDWLDYSWKEAEKKDQHFLRKLVLKFWMKAVLEISLKRLGHQGIVYEGKKFALFYKQDPKTRLILWLRYANHWFIPEIAEFLGMQRYEVVERLHNARYLMGSALAQSKEVLL